jgi:uncharacterized protein YndB with AHSA1/START domain
MSTDDAEITITRHGAEVAAILSLPERAPAAVLAAFTEPELLRTWWPGELTAELKPGGLYRVRFASLGQTMNGVVEAYDPGKRLVFSWGWAHELELAGRFLVAVTVSQATTAAAPDRPGRTVLELRHGPRPGSALTPRAGEVEGHLEGWEYFLPRLAAAV